MHLRLIEYYKLGYTILTDQVNREIRFKRISKSDTINLVNERVSGDFKNLTSITSFLGASEESLLAIGYILKGLGDFNKIQDYFNAVNSKKLVRYESLKVFGKGYP